MIRCIDRATGRGGRPPAGVPGWTASAVVAGLVLACLLPAAEAVGCPTCKDGLAAGDPEGMNLARGYFYSILIMLAMPFALVSSFGAYVWREMRRQKRAGTGASTPPLP